MVEETIKLKAKELENKYNMNYYEALQRFMLERVLERISVSKYQDNIIYFKENLTKSQWIKKRGISVNRMKNIKLT